MAQIIPRKLKEEIERWMEEGRYGHLQINFAGGKIVNVNKVESVRIDMLVANPFTNNVPKDAKLE